MGADRLRADLLIFNKKYLLNGECSLVRIGVSLGPPFVGFEFSSLLE